MKLKHIALPLVAATLLTTGCSAVQSIDNLTNGSLSATGEMVRNTADIFRGAPGGVERLAPSEVDDFVNKQYAHLNGAFSRTPINVRKNRESVIVTIPSDAAIKNGQITSAYAHHIKTLATSLNQHPQSMVRVIGHTDNSDNALLAAETTRHTANAVSVALRDGGVARDRVRIRPAGSGEPVGPNDSASGREKNRRVEVHIEPVVGK